MNQKYEKLKGLLKELFQLDQPDLDFGIYRILHARSAEVTKFLDQDLLPQVKQAFGQYKTADKAELEKELAKLVANIEAAGMNPDDSPKVKELRAKLASESVDVSALENEVYDHLLSFFRRYYSEGDFLSKRVYKQGVYAIPYEGEEVKLHWANSDQYYIKTSEYLRDYAFRLRPEDEQKPMRVHFRLVDAAEGEHGNVKAAEGKDRVFVLAAPGDSGTEFIAEENGELILRFEYRPATVADWPAGEGKAKPPVQKDLIAISVKRVLAVTGAEFGPWIAELGKMHFLSSGEKADYTKLEAHLRRYTARNTFDYFIHKDLGGFLRRELDFYIKNEVMQLDDVENESAPRVEQYLSKIKVIRRIAGKIIEFLAQLEDFQKKLWLKKKFVVETNYCITLGNIPEEFYPEIVVNEAQRDEWVRLLGVDQISGDLVTPGYSAPLTVDFLKSYPSLVVDTRFFAEGFTVRLLTGLEDLDRRTDALLVHSENFQALEFFQRRLQGAFKCITIDPPYNTGGDGFAYKDNYQHSSWATMIRDRLLLSGPLLSDDGVFFATIDDGEQPILKLLVDEVFGAEMHLPSGYWEKVYSPRMDAQALSEDHDHIVMAGSGVARVPFEQNTGQFNYTEPATGRQYRRRSLRKEGSNSRRVDRPNLYYPIASPDGTPVWPIRSDGSEGCWRWSPERFAEAQGQGTTEWVKVDGQWQIFVKQYLSDDATRPASTLWRHDEVGHNHEATELIKQLFVEKAFSTPKPPRLIQFMHSVAGVGPQDSSLDFFAGSGTTGHAVINLNRGDGGRRKFTLVEIGAYFDTVLIPRLKKVIFSPDWKDGKPSRMATPEEAERSPRIMKVIRLESYEDTLNNLEVRRTKGQQAILDFAAAQGADGLKEEYLLKYMLDVETRGSQSLLNIDAFSDPAAYKLKVKRPGSDESREVNVDLLETFNWLIGLAVDRIAAPQTFAADCDPDSEGRLRMKGALKPDPKGPWWFRTVTGNLPDGRRALIIWRKLTGDPGRDNLVLDEWFGKQEYSTKDSEFDVIYVNGGNNLGNMQAVGDNWKVRLIEEDFHRLMFETEGV